MLITCVEEWRCGEYFDWGGMVKLETIAERRSSLSVGPLHHWGDQMRWVWHVARMINSKAGECLVENRQETRPLGRKY